MKILPLKDSLLSPLPFKSTAWKGYPRGACEALLYRASLAIGCKVPRLPCGEGEARGAGSGNAWHPAFTIAMREKMTLPHLASLASHDGMPAEVKSEITAALAMAKRLKIEIAPLATKLVKVDSAPLETYTPKNRF